MMSGAQVISCACQVSRKAGSLKAWATDSYSMETGSESGQLVKRQANVFE